MLLLANRSDEAHPRENKVWPGVLPRESCEDTERGGNRRRHVGLGAAVAELWEPSQREEECSRVRLVHSSTQTPQGSSL